MFILSSISVIWSVNYTSIYEIPELVFFSKNITTRETHEISNNWPHDLLGANVYKTLESC